ncbi:MAG TPA: hypothetical protein DCG28_01760 [Lachnospiraceae bacterium]|nr:hypothetical protein [Lachnospiraceae bacterium]
MLEEQANGLVKQGIFAVLRLLKDKTMPIISNINQATTIKPPTTARQTVRELVEKGRDLKLSEVIQSKQHLTEVCYELKKQGIAFAIKRDSDGNRQLLYQKKDGDLVEKSIKTVLNKNLQKSRTLMDLLNRNKAISDKEAQKIKNKEKAREER